jgi:hypothetical protein
MAGGKLNKIAHSGGQRTDIHRLIQNVQRARLWRSNCAVASAIAARIEDIAILTGGTMPPAPSLAPFAAVVPRLPIVAGAQTTADKS